MKTKTYECIIQTDNNLYNCVVSIKRVKNCSFKYLNNKLYLTVNSLYSREKDIKRLIEKNEDRIIKLINQPRKSINEDEFIIFGHIYKKSDYSTNDIKKMQEDAFNIMIEHFNNIKKINNFPNASLYIRKMRSRWGVCFPQKNKIGLSSYLIYVPIHLIDYVIYHEFCHFKYQNHSKYFYDELSKYSPDNKKLRKEIKEYSYLLYK